MARNRSGRNRNRRRNGGNSGLYARPIIEPSNFVELDIGVDTSVSGGGVTYAAVQSAFAALVTSANVGKFRIASIVCDQPTVKPASNTAGGSVSTCDLFMGLSGHHFAWSNLQKPLRIRFGKDVGDDGQWIIMSGATSIPADAFPGAFTSSGSLVTFVPPAGVSVTLTLHVRIAFTDVGSV